MSETIPQYFITITQAKLKIAIFITLGNKNREKGKIYNY